MKHVKLGVLFAGALALGLVACGEDEEEESGSTLTVKGVVVGHPLSTAAATAGGTTVVLEDLAVALINPPSVAPIANAVIDPTTCTTVGCPFTLVLEDFNAETVALGLAFIVDNTPTSTANAFVQTGSGAASVDTVKAAAAGTGILEGVKAFAITQAAVDVVATMTGNSATDTIANGCLVGMVVDDTLAPVAGATVTDANGNITPVYPDDTLAATGTATGATGMFFGVSTAPTLKLSNWTVNPPAGNTKTWDATVSGTNPEACYALMLTGY